MSLKIFIFQSRLLLLSSLITCQCHLDPSFKLWQYDKWGNSSRTFWLSFGSSMTWKMRKHKSFKLKWEKGEKTRNKRVIPQCEGTSSIGFHFPGCQKFLLRGEVESRKETDCPSMVEVIFQNITKNPWESLDYAGLLLQVCGRGWGMSLIDLQHVMLFWNSTVWPQTILLVSLCKFFSFPGCTFLLLTSTWIFWAIYNHSFFIFCVPWPSLMNSSFYSFSHVW